MKGVHADTVQCGLSSELAVAVPSELRSVSLEFSSCQRSQALLHAVGEGDAFLHIAIDAGNLVIRYDFGSGPSEAIDESIDLSGEWHAPEWSTAPIVDFCSTSNLHAF